MRILIFLILILTNCGYLSDAVKGLSPFLKFLTVTTATETKITSVLPKNKSTGNFLNTNVFIVFNKSISGFDSKSFIISSDDGKTPHPGKIEMLNNVLAFYPNPIFALNTTYKLTIKPASGLKSESEYTFTTGTNTDFIPPFVASTNPATGDKDMPINIAVNATFNEILDPTTIDSDRFSVTNVSGNVNLNDQTITIKPGSNLPSNATLTGTIKSGVKDLCGNIMTAPYSWTFRTGSSIATNCTFEQSNHDNCIIAE